MAPGSVGVRSRQCKCLSETEITAGQVAKGTPLPEVPTYSDETMKKQETEGLAPEYVQVLPDCSSDLSPFPNSRSDITRRE
jgi:hypothetical protein